MHMMWGRDPIASPLVFFDKTDPLQKLLTELTSLRNYNQI
jgi:hypothetical protein